MPTEIPSATTLNALLLVGLVAFVNDILAIVDPFSLFGVLSMYYSPVFIIILVASAVAVYFDCRNLRRLGVWEEDAGGWIAGVVIFWIAVLPYYLYKRSKALTGSPVAPRVV